MEQDRIPRRHNEDDPWFGGVTPYAESDVRKNLQSGGTSRTSSGRARDAYQMARVKEAHERLHAGARMPPRTREAIMDPKVAKEYEARMAGDSKGMKKSGSFFGGPTLPGLAMGGIPIYTDPLNSPTRHGIPTWHEDMPEDEKSEMQRLTRSWCKWYKRNHYLIPTLFDIYARYPFVGMDLQCPDPVVEDEYSQIFFDLLNYEELLPLASMQYWVTGEAAMFGEWDPEFKAWSDEQILDSDYIEVRRWPVPTINREAFFWYPPESLRSLLDEQDWDDPRYRSIYEEYSDYIQDWKDMKPNELPSEVFTLLRHDQDVGGDRGYPILMRGFSILMEEEKLNQAMTAVADRLYTPFLVAKLGSNNLLPEGEPWIPDNADLEAMQAHLEMVMASRYRLMVWHSGIEFENPLEGMNVPNLNEDFDRTALHIADVFGISLDLIHGGQAGPYAAGALSAEVMMQRLAASQKVWTRWWIQDRAKRIAQERGYYQVEWKGNQPTYPTEKTVVKEWNGTRYVNRVKERKRLQLPRVRLETMDWRDQQEKFNNFLQLKRMGVFIPDSYLVKQADPAMDVGHMNQAYVEEEKEKQRIQNELGIQPQQQGQGAGGMMGGGGGPPGGGGMHAPSPAPGGAPGRAGPGSRPPQSDEMRGEQPSPQNPGLGQEPQPGGPGGPAVQTSLNKEEASNGHEENGSEENGYEENGDSYSESKKGFDFFRRTGANRGTLYYLDGDHISHRRCD